MPLSEKSQISDHGFFLGVPVDKFHKSNVAKIFVQPAFITNFTDNFAMAFSTRFTSVAFSNIQTDYTVDEVNRYQLDSLSYAPLYFWEPALNINFGFPDVPVKFRFQMSFSSLLSNRFFWYRDSNVAIGVVYDFRPFKK